MGNKGSARESERRQASILFADISGFTTMSAQMDPEEVTSILNDCFQMIGSIVEHYGGIIDKFIGDCIMVLFGVPLAVEEASQKAVNTAIEIRNKLAQFNEEKKLKLPLDIHIGINTGTVVAGVVGSIEKREYTVMGDAVNLASRLKDVAGKGRIYVGPLTYRYTKNDFAYSALEPLSLKGKKEPVSVYELLSVKEKIYRAPFGSDRMIYSEMVGRENELSKLERHILNAISGQGSIVSVVGDAGIGKSRLIAELKRKDTIKRVLLLEGRALSNGKNLSFHPIIDILKRWAGIEDDDTEKESIRKLEEVIWNAYPEGVTEALPFIAILMSLKSDGEPAQRIKGIEGEALQKCILVSLREIIVKAAEHKPIVFVIEDLHWADMSSIELLEALYQLAEHNRIVFINMFRPNYTDTGERLLNTIRERYSKYQSEIYLQPLDEKQCGYLVNNLLKSRGIPTHIGELISIRAEGNPFFIEEVVRSFIDDGIVTVKNGHFEVTEKIDSAVIPITIQDLLMSRIDNLDYQTKLLLKIASVIGRTFSYRILIEVAKTIDGIDEKLDLLQKIQLIGGRSRSGMAEIEYSFKHALVHETIYESILLSKRRELHLQIANCMETVFSEELHKFYGSLALHYSRGEDFDKAEEFLRKAGEEALKASASSEALNYYKEASRLYLKRYGDSDDSEKIADLEKNIALALYNKGRNAEAIEHFDKVLECWGVRRPKDNTRVFVTFISNALNILITLYSPLKKRKRLPTHRDNEIINLSQKMVLSMIQTDTRRMFMETMGIMKNVNELDLTKVENGAQIYLESSGVFSFSGISFRIARRILDYTKDYLDTADIKSAFLYKYYELILDFLTGNWTNELAYDEDLVDRYLKTGDVNHASGYTVFWALLRIEQGDFDGAKLLLDRLGEIGDVYDHNYTRGAKLIVNAKLLLKCRKLHDALSEAEAGMLLSNKNGRYLSVLFSSAIKANAQIIMDDIREAEITLLQSRDFVLKKRLIAPFYAGGYLMSQALFDLYTLRKAWSANDKRRTAELRPNVYRSMKAAARNSAKYAVNKTEAFKSMGVYYWLIGNQDNALKWLGKSMKIGEQLGALPELARTYMEVGKRLIEKESKIRKLNGIKAEEYLNKAEALFERMGLEWDLKELKQIKSNGGIP